MNLPRPNRDHAHKARNSARVPRGSPVTTETVSEEALLPLGHAQDARKYDLRQFVLFPTTVPTALTKRSDRKDTCITHESRPASPPTASPQPHRFDLEYTQDIPPHGIPLSNDRASRSREDPSPPHPPGLAIPPQPIRYNFEIEPSHPSGLSNYPPARHNHNLAPFQPPVLTHDRAHCNGDFAPTHFQETVPISLPVPTPRSLYEDDSASQFELDLPTLKYSWGPPPSPPLSKRVGRAMFGWIDYLQRYEPRPYHLPTRGLSIGNSRAAVASNR